MKGFERVDQRFDEIDRRFERIDQRFDEVDRRFERIDGRFKEMDSRFMRVEGELARVNDRLDGMHRTMVQGIVAITGGMVAGFGGIMAVIATQL
jgi:predicted nuclease with TOPRIM domain